MDDAASLVSVSRAQQTRNRNLFSNLFYGCQLNVFKHVLRSDVVYCDTYHKCVLPKTGIMLTGSLSVFKLKVGAGTRAVTGLWAETLAGCYEPCEKLVASGQDLTKTYMSKLCLLKTAVYISSV